MSSDDPRQQLRSLIGQLPPEVLAELGSNVLRFPEQRSEPVPSRRRPRRAAPARYRIKVTLDDSHPPIWRRLDVRSDLTLDTFHQVLQAAFGWEDSHLHRFASGGSSFDRDAEHYLCEWDAAEGDEGIPEVEVRLDETMVDPGDALRYCYDYGDDWGLTIRLEAVQPAEAALPAAVCVGGRRAAPPEDCGGLRTADELAEVLDDPTAFDVDEVNATLTDPFVGVSGTDAHIAPELAGLMRRLHPDPAGEPFRQVIRQVLATPPPATTAEQRARAVRPILFFLHHVGSKGLPLTSAGYLRPADVAALAAELPTMRDWIGLANREIQTFPVMLFREAVLAIGLLRKVHGRLMLTKAGTTVVGNNGRLWPYLLDRLPIGSDKSMDRPSGWLYLVAAIAGIDDPYGEIAGAMTYLGWREDGRREVSGMGVRHSVGRTSSLLANLAASSTGIFDRQEVDPVVQDLCHQIIRGTQR